MRLTKRKFVADKNCELAIHFGIGKSRHQEDPPCSQLGPSRSALCVGMCAHVFRASAAAHCARPPREATMTARNGPASSARKARSAICNRFHDGSFYLPRRRKVDVGGSTAPRTFGISAMAHRLVRFAALTFAEYCNCSVPAAARLNFSGASYGSE